MRNTVSEVSSLSRHDADKTTGWLTPEAREQNGIDPKPQTRVQVLGKWQQISLSHQMSDMYWQFGFSGWSYGRNHDDGFTIFLDEYVRRLGMRGGVHADFPTSPEAQPLVYEHAAAVNRASAKL